MKLMSKSILIIDTPKDCFSCPLFKPYSVGGRCNVRAGREEIEKSNEKFSDCPLKELVKGEYQFDGESLTPCMWY